MINEKLLKAVAKLNSEYVNIELGNTRFIDVTEIEGIGKFFGIGLTKIDEEFQALKDTKYEYDKFCDLCDEGKEDDSKLLSEVFDYLEIQKFAEMIIKKVAEKMQERINQVL